MTFRDHVTKIAATFHKCLKNFRALVAVHGCLPKRFNHTRGFFFALKLTAVYFNEPVIEHDRSLVDNFAGLTGSCLRTAKTRAKINAPQVFGLLFCLRYSCLVQLGICTPVELLEQVPIGFTLTDDVYRNCLFSVNIKFLYFG